MLPSQLSINYHRYTLKIIKEQKISNRNFILFLINIIFNFFLISFNCKIFSFNYTFFFCIVSKIHFHVLCQYRYIHSAKMNNVLKFNFFPYERGELICKMKDEEEEKDGNQNEIKFSFFFSFIIISGFLSS